MPPPFATIQQRYALLAIYNEAAPTVRQIVNDVRFGSRLCENVSYDRIAS